MGPHFRRLALGAGDTNVTATPWVARSRSRETTFQQDLTDPDEIRDQVRLLARRVAEDVRAEGRPAVRVVVKVRFVPFFTSTRGVPLAEPTTDVERIEDAAVAALARFDDTRAVRLLGVRAEFTGGRP
jgi:DNA polymerase-4